jgi:hypothetical protein
MPVERTTGGTSLIDVLDRVLDKGIVIDAWVRVSLVGIDLITVEARVVVASIETYLKYSEAVGTITPASKPSLDGRANDAVLAENAALRAQIAASGREPVAARRTGMPLIEPPRFGPRRDGVSESTLRADWSWRKRCLASMTSPSVPSGPSTGFAGRWVSAAASVSSGPPKAPLS